ncbi:MAG: NAD(P)-binding oxidoreductase [Parasphingorhabdus sp.]|uniref:NAD(P)-dependent oxidoreductase n=1 Tax=Parasphingorhabdus sp. TaxID=2709688 RepID=UPI0032648C7E
MTILVLGATGATGRLLVQYLLERSKHVRIIVRSKEALPKDLLAHDNLSVTEASLLDLSDAAITEQVTGCDAIVSCLGHNMTFKGMFLPPRRLVTDATRRLCEAAAAVKPATPIRFVLMNTSGNSNRDLDEPLSSAQKIVLALIRTLVPPHADNEAAADYLRTEIGQQDAAIEWTAVRPDGLIDAPEATPFEVHPSPIRSAIFDAGQTSRMNVASFMGDLVIEDDIWAQWKGQMPVIYNVED